jgi:type IV pilus biogenesis protein CpaD/CtpE
MARIRIAALLAGLVALAAGSGCARDSAVADHWGDAQRQNTSQMVANPEADKLPAQEGIDGVTAEQTMDSYRRAQAKGKGRGATSSVINIDAK